MNTTRPTAPFGTRDDIADYQRRQSEIKRQENEQAAQAKAERERDRAAANALDDGSPPTVLGRVFTRQASGLVELVLVDRLTAGVPLRVLLARGEAADPVNLIGTLRALGATLLEAQGYQHPEGRLWSKGVIDPFGGGSIAIPTNLPAVGEPLYRLPATTEPSDEERASAVELAREAVEVLSPTKSRARDLAASLRAAIATGPHAIEALALVLEQRAGIAPTDETEPPRAA